VSQNQPQRGTKERKKKEMNIHNVIIIGGGCAGLSAAIYTGRAEWKPLIFVGSLENSGGLLSKTSMVENFPGHKEILGFDLMQNMEEQAKHCGAEIIQEEIKSVNLQSYPFRVRTESKNIFLSKSIIVATGSTPNKLKLPNEAMLWGKGISSCAVCDGALYKGKRIVVVGGGDAALTEALFLTTFSQVLLIHRRRDFRASKALQRRVLENKKITLLLDSTIIALQPSSLGKLESILVQHVPTQSIKRIPVDGLFYGLGLTPNSQLFQKQVSMDEQGYIRAGFPLVLEDSMQDSIQVSTMTSVPGVFVAGDVHDQYYRQAVTACGEGCKAALDVGKFLDVIRDIRDIRDIRLLATKE
jgi:thioredoxin reductase (NADPH)